MTFFSFQVCTNALADELGFCVGSLFVRYPGTPLPLLFFSFFFVANELSVAGPFDHYDTKSEPLRKDSFALTLQLSGPDFHRDDRRQQPDQSRTLQADSNGYSAHSDEFSYWRVSSALFFLSLSAII